MDFVQKKKNLSAQSYRENSISAQEQNHLSFIFQSTESFQRLFFKRNLRATATSAINCFQHIGWNLGIFILGFGKIQTLTWLQYVWGRKGVKWLSRRRRQTHLLLKLNNANYAEQHQCQQGSSPSTWKEMALFPNQS